jgi:Flp pilus assembly protein TadD/Leucine-rich repeat (LRR) protein
MKDEGLSGFAEGTKQAAEGPSSSSFIPHPSSLSSSATMAGSIMGTPQYMAPEQARGEVETMDARADIYALGAILYHLLALRPSVTGGDAMAIVEKVAAGEIEALGNVGGHIPDSLAAVVRKAMALDKARRYAAVADLQAELTAFQNGFATSAEQAGAWKQFTLFVKRNKAASIGVAAVLLVGGVLGTKAILEGRRAEREAAAAKASLAELRATAPTFFAQAKLLTDQEKLGDALEKIDIALKLNPSEGGFHAQRGNILQSMERFAEAAHEYAVAAKLNPQEPNAAENAALSRALAEMKEKDGAISVNQRTQWRDALVQQGRPEEAIFAGRGLGNDVQKMRPAWQAKIDAWLGKNAPRVGIRGSGFDLSLIGLSLTDLSPLRGMPLTGVNVDKNPHLQDLSPLTDCPLEDFSASGASELADLSPLRGKKLKSVDLRGTNVSDLSALAGMPLVGARLGSTPISDLTPLRGTKLKTLYLGKTQVRDLGPLAGLPLEYLDVKGSPITGIEPVADAPLTFLEIDVPFDLAVLRPHRLRTLHALGSMFAHPEELAKMTDLEVLILPADFSDPAPLRNLRHLRKIDFPESYTAAVESLKNAADFFRQYDAPPCRATREALKKCGLNNVPVRNVNVDPAGRLCVDLNHMTIGDFTPLRELPIKELNLEGTGILNLEALRGMALDTLNIRFTKVSDLGPLRGSPLTRVRVDSARVQDIDSLADCPELEWVSLPPNARNVQSLRALKKLRYLSTKWDSNANRPAQTAEEFWREYDAQRAPAKK